MQRFPSRTAFIIVVAFLTAQFAFIARAATLTDIYYYFDNTDTPTYAKDSSGNGYDIAYLGGTTQTSSQARFGTGSLLTGTTSSIGFQGTLGSGPLVPLNYEISEMTVTLWVNPQVVSNMVFFQRLRTSTGNAGYFRFYQQSNTLRFAMDALDGTGGSYSATSSSAVNLATGEWTHVAMTFKNGDVTFYRNGVQLGNAFNIGANTIPMTSATSSTRIEGILQLGTFQGSIDDFGFFGSKALSAEEISTVYNSGLQAFVVPEPASAALLFLFGPILAFAGLKISRRRR